MSAPGEGLNVCTYHFNSRSISQNMSMANDGMNEGPNYILPLGKRIISHMTCDCYKEKQYTRDQNIHRTPQVN